MTEGPEPEPFAGALHVVSYNVLATSYIKPQWYRHVDDAWLDPAWRRPALAARAARLDADVLCLQEVEPPMFEALAAALGDAFVGELALKARNKPDGSALFVRRARAQIVDPQRLVYAAPADSGHIAQIATLLLADGERAIDVANTHLRWDPAERDRGDKVGVAQAEQLVDALDARAGRDAARAAIVCGDLNAALDSDALQVFAAAGFTAAHAALAETGAASCAANRQPKLIDHVLVRGDVHTRARALPMQLDADSALPDAREPSDHLPLGADVWLGREAP